jgi:Zn-dependent M28 family amino/carboxypeptidase
MLFVRIAIFGLLLAIPTFVGCALVVQPGVKPIASRPPPVDAAALRRHVDALTHDFHPRSASHHANLERAADYLVAELRAVGASPVSQPVKAPEGEYRNIIARFGPDTGPVTVVGAHYDSHGDTPGADDNASGVAALLELARLLAAHPPKTAIELVAYTLEEPPHFRTPYMGSVTHAQALKDSKRDIEFVLVLETIGYFRDEAGSQNYPMAFMKSYYPPAGDFIAIVNRFGDFGATRRVKARFAGASDLTVTSINAPSSIQGVDFSDHRSYWAEDITALMVTDTAFYRNPNYHQLGDTADTLDYERLAKVTQGTYAAVTEP